MDSRAVETSKVLQDLLKWAIAVVVQKSDRPLLGPGADCLGLDLRDSTGEVVIEIPVSAHVLGEMMPHGILNHKLWRDHTFQVFEGLQSALYIPGFYNEHPRIYARWSPGHSRTAVLLYTAEKDWRAIDVFVHAVHSLREEGLWILNPVIARNGRLIGPGHSPPWDIFWSRLQVMMGPVNPIAQFSKRLTPSTPLSQYLVRVNKRIATTFCRRLVISDDMLSGPYPLAGRTYGNFRFKSAYGWEWVAFRFGSPLSRTKPLVYVNGSADHSVLHSMDIPQAFWDLGILVFMTIHTAVSRISLVRKSSLNPIYEVVYDVLTQFPEVVPVWVVSWRGAHMQLLDITRINAASLEVKILEGIEGIILEDEIQGMILDPWAVAEIQAYAPDNSASLEIPNSDHLQLALHRWKSGCNVVVRVLRLGESIEVASWVMAWKPLLPMVSPRLRAVRASARLRSIIA